MSVLIFDFSTCLLCVKYMHAKAQSRVPSSGRREPGTGFPGRLRREPSNCCL